MRAASAARSAWEKLRGSFGRSARVVARLAQAAQVRPPAPQLGEAEPGSRPAAASITSSIGASLMLRRRIGSAPDRVGVRPLVAEELGLGVGLQGLPVRLDVGVEEAGGDALAPASPRPR